MNLNPKILKNELEISLGIDNRIVVKRNKINNDELAETFVTVFLDGIKVR